MVFSLTKLRANAWNMILYYPYWHLAVHRPSYISICLVHIDWLLWTTVLFQHTHLLGSSKLCSCSCKGGHFLFLFPFVQCISISKSCFYHLSLHHTIFFPVSLFFFFTAVLSSLYFSLYILLFPYHVNTTLVRYSLPLIQSPPLWPKLLLTPSLFILSFKVTPLILRLGILIDAVSNKL